MQLSRIIGRLDQSLVFGKTSVEIDGISSDSREIGKNFLFVAIRGERFDGHQFINDVIKKGAVAVIGEKEPDPSWKDICYIKVPSSRMALSKVASFWYGDPAKKLTIIGVTGTKGKTTTSTIIYHLLNKAGKTGLICTNGAIIGRRRIDTGLHVTNPEPIILHKLLSEMVKEGCRYAVIEVTSHGLDQERVAGIKFDAAVFTNISHEHLDYHKSMKNYVAAKAKLFDGVPNAVLNADDRHFRYILKKCIGKVITYSTKRKDAHYFLIDRGETGEKLNFSIRDSSGIHNMSASLIGNFNLQNILAAVCVARLYGVSWDMVSERLSKIPRIEGRLEKVSNDRSLSIYIDFAHNPDSLKKVLRYLREKTRGRLISVFGCAAERDTKKRPMMGRISVSLADISIFTSEDPRNENPEKIIDEIAEGARQKTVSGDAGQIGTYYKIPDRGKAIWFAINKIASPGDTIVICGKGHEKSMNYAGIEYLWSDKLATKLALDGKILTLKERA